MDNNLLSEVVNELHSLNNELRTAFWSSQTHEELLTAVDKLEEDIDNLIDHIEYQKFSLAFHKDK